MENVEAYLPRLVDRQLERYLRTFGAVEIVGCKWCGKTWTATAHGNSIIRFDDAQTRALVEADLSFAFEGTPPHIIDEWQVVPSLWDATRHMVDDAGSKKGLYILTGSATPQKDQVSHSGAGRIAQTLMRPMSLAETGASDCSISLNDLFDGRFNKGAVKTDLRALARYICKGGWPGALHIEHDEDINLIPIQYLDNLVSNDVPRKGLNQQIMQRVLLALARNIGGLATYETLGQDMLEGEDPDGNDDADNNYAVSRQTIARYLGFLKDQFLIEDTVGWDAPLKSQARTRSKPKRAFVDPSLPAALLGVNADRLLSEMQVFGQLFEELCLRDLKIYASLLDGTWSHPVRYYRDSDGLEVDAILELIDGRWAALEIKLSQSKVAEGVKNLLRLKEKIKSNPAAQNREPEFLAVLVGKTDFKYQTPEGIYVIPITSLTV